MSGPEPARIIRVLLVEDNPGDALLIRLVLGEAGPAHFEVRHVTRLADALLDLDRRPIDLVLLDLSLPDTQGIETVTQVVAHAPEVPVVVMTGLDDERLALAAVNAGAQEYVVKGQMEPRSLLRTLRHAMARKQQLADLAADRERERHRATHDPLTGLPNRALFLDRLEQSVAFAERYRTELALLFIDLDGFKQINDHLGHGAGDELLVSVAQRLQSLLRRSDTVARYGGDEFVAILANVPSARVLRRLCRGLVERLGEPYVLGGQTVSVTASVGVAVYPRDGERLETLVTNADHAMYRAKAEGKNRVELFALDPGPPSLDPVVFADEFRGALARGEFQLHYQPRIDLETRRAVAVEALVRWQHPRHGLLRPEEFLAMAEETGTIQELGGWVLRQACRDAVAWRDLGLDLAMAVNVSARELAHDGFQATLRAALVESGFDPRCLELEITESRETIHAPQAVENLTRARELGIRVLIDDFGTGFASLAFLRDIPCDGIKLSGTFLRHAPERGNDRHIAAAMIGMAHALGLATVAEGIEARPQLDFVAAHGCRLVQGFLIAEPMPAELLTAQLAGPWVTVAA